MRSPTEGLTAKVGPEAVVALSLDPPPAVTRLECSAESQPTSGASRRTTSDWARAGGVASRETQTTRVVGPANRITEAPILRSPRPRRSW